MTANVDAMVRAGVEAFRAGNKVDARALLERALEIDEYNEQAWLWLSAAVETPEEQLTCLQNVLVINPNNERARAGLKSLGIDPNAKPVEAAPPPPAPAASATPAFTADDWGDLGDEDDDDEPATASSSASSRSFKGSGHSANDLDDWVSNLGIGGKKPAPTMPEPAFSASDPFGNLDDIDDLFGQDDDLPVVTSKTPALMEDIEIPLDDPFEELELDDDDFDVSDDVLADFDDAVGAGIERTSITEYEDDLSIAHDLLNEDLDEDGEPDIQHYFQMIPKEIEASRLPGEDAENPTLLLGGVVVLGVLNVIGLFIFLGAIAG